MHDKRPLSRREFLQGASAAAVTLAGTIPAAAEQARSFSNAALLDLSAVDAVRAMQSGALQAERYAGALLERCAALKHLNAFITLQPELVLEQAREADRKRASGAALGPLHGLPIPVKDSLNTAQYPTTAGTPALRNFRPNVDAPLVASLRAAGALILGKTNLHELSFGWTSNNLAYGAVHNPYDTTRIPGGSSGGTAAAIAARMAPLGVAEDTEGSIRVPAALCGLIGFRPSTRRYSTLGVVPACALFDQTGPHARTMGDIALFDRVASGDARPVTGLPLKGVRLAVWREFWFEGLDPQVARITEEALDKLRAAGVSLVEAPLPELQDLLKKTADVIADHDARLELTRYLKTFDAPVNFNDLVAQASPDIRAIFAHEVLPGSPGFVTESAYRIALQNLQKLRSIFQRYFADSGASAIVFPTTLVTAPKIGEDTELDIGSRRVSFDVAIGRNIAPGSRTGLPGLVLPAGLSAQGLPVGLEFDGPAGSDRRLLSLGITLEAVLGHVPGPTL